MTMQPFENLLFLRDFLRQIFSPIFLYFFKKYVSNTNLFTYENVCARIDIICTYLLGTMKWWKLNRNEDISFHVFNDRGACVLLFPAYWNHQWIFHSIKKVCTIPFPIFFFTLALLPLQRFFSSTTLENLKFYHEL